MISKLKVPYLFLNLAIYAGFAAVFLATPVRFADMIGIQLQSSAALADFRAVYGGLCLGISLVLIAGIASGGYRRGAILLATACGGGLLLGRLITLLFDGPGNLYIYVSMASEVFALGAGLVLLRAEEYEKG
ncbi:MAG: DUF4345 family protein [Leptospirales bacterium]|nr:DUF4345 family protein [Leptospirales bacterium]